jgi:NTE family protein
MTVRNALVLGGGGLAGIAWMTGLLAGLADAGQDVTDADLVIGTSAGSVVAAQLGGALPLEDLYARQADPALQTAEIFASIDMESFGAQHASFMTEASSAQDRLLAAGAFALTASTVPEADRRAVIAARLPSHDWPRRPIKLVAIDCEDATTAIFEATSQVSLVDAVAASCAVPGVWPPVTIGGRRFMDGGARSTDNADLAEGAARIIIASPFGMSEDTPSVMPLPEVVTRLREGGAEVTVIEPDAASRAAFGTNPLDPATRRPAAEAGRTQGRAGLPAAS